MQVYQSNSNTLFPVSLGIIIISLNTTPKSKSTRYVFHIYTDCLFLILSMSFKEDAFWFDFQLAEKYFVKGGDPRAAIEMYTKANMYEAAHKVLFIC